MIKNICLITLALLLPMCGPKEPPVAPVMMKKIVKAKKESMTTSYQYVVDPLGSGGLLKQRMHLKTIYYLTFTDGTYESVDIGKYSVTDVGDTVVVRQY